MNVGNNLKPLWVLQTPYRWEVCMTPVPVVTVSPKFQVVIPKEVRERLGIQPGQKLRVWDDGRKIQLVPTQSAAALKGVFSDRPLPPLERDLDRVL